MTLAGCASSPARAPGTSVALPQAPAPLRQVVPAPDIEAGQDSRVLNARLIAALDAANTKLLGWMAWYRELRESYAGDGR